MDDTLVKTNGGGGTGGSPVPHKLRATVLRGGRGGPNNSYNPHSSHSTHLQSKNKTWVSGARKSASPAPEGRWERGRSFGGGAGGGRGRGRGAAHGVNGHFSSNSSSVFGAAGENTANVVQNEYDGVSDVAAGPSHRATPVAFPPPPSSGNGTGKTWEELVKGREEERARAIREGKMDDPTKPKRLEEAITMVGTCQDMCPEFERYRRERENNLDKWECIVGPDGKPTKKVDHDRAVKIYERGQGDKIIPSDLRPAPVLKRTLDYLFRDLIPRGGFADTQAFVRDRSRAVRNDFTIQQDSGPIAIECHERCTRFHILSLHLMYDTPKFDRALEMQQLMNSLLSLKEFYDDQRGNYESPNELEMRIYHRLGLIRDQHERNDRPPPHVASDPAFQLITRFRSEVQAASSPITKTSKLKVSPAAMQTFGEFADVLRQRRNIVMIYLTACFLEHIFGKDTIDDIESIKGSLLIQEIIDGYPEPEGGAYAGVDEIEDADMGEEMVTDGGVEEQDDLSAFIQEDDGALGTVEEADTSQPDDALALPPGQTIFQSKSAPEFPSSSSSPFGGPKTQSSFTPIPPSESVFGKIVGSSSSPSAFAKPGSSSVFGTTFNAFSPKSNVFGGAVFGGPSTTSSPAPPKVVEIPKENVSVFPSQPSFSPQTSSSTSVPPSTSTILQETKPLRSLADAGPLLSGGKEDHVQPSQAIQTRKPPAPFPISQSAPALNPFAPSFEPSPIRTSQTSSSFPTASRSSLPPLKTDSPLSRIVDPSRGFVTPVDSPSYSFLSPPKPTTRSVLSLDTGAALERYGESSKHLGKSPAIESPVAPPPLGRRAPISLPGTPTVTIPSSSIPPVEPTTPSTPYSFPALRVKISSTTTSTPNPIPSSSSHVIEETAVSPGPSPPPNVSTPLTNGTSPKKPPPSPETKERLREQAMAFRRRHGLVPEVFRRWKQKMLKTMEWKEACKRGEEYKRKIRESSTNGSISSLGSIPSSSSFKRQRSEAELVTEQPKRPRRSLHRMSNPSERRTDKDLEELLMKNDRNIKNQNHEKMERRWAKGQFVKAIQEYVRSRVDEIPQNWATWLCMNASNDKTAIWLEKKFDVPESGSWASESVFSIPISPDPSAVFPGLIVFECTPLEEVDDEIEKKYRVLDDCARLRDVISILPENRHYSPSLLFINWDASPDDDVHSDITGMAAKYVKDGLIRNVTNVTMTSDDTDEVFTKCLQKLDADLEGKYIAKLGLPDFFKHLSSPWEDAVKVWVEACSSDEIFNWLMFSHIVEHFVESLDSLLRIMLSAWNKKPVRAVLITMPSFGVDRDESVPNVCYEWLRSFGVTIDQGDDPLRFFSDLLRIAFTYAQQFAKNPSQQRPILHTTLEEISAQCANALEESQERLRAVVKTLPRPSPKRIVNGASVNGRSPGESFSQVSSPSPSGSKRARLSESFDSLSETNYTGDQTISQETTDQYDSFIAPGSPTPSVATSIATSVGNSSISASVSAKMLRELSRDVLKKYGKAKRKTIG